MIWIRKQRETAGGVEAASGGACESAPRHAAVATFAPGALNWRAASLSAAPVVDRQTIAREVSLASPGLEVPV
jgi:hypothetical protein